MDQNPLEYERNLLGLITDVQHGMARLFRERTRHIGLSRSQWRVLAGLAGRPGATQTELAELVGIGRAPLGKTIDRLEQKGWVERRDDPQDRRVNRLYITKDFRPIAEPTRDISRTIERELLAQFSAQERNELYRMVARLRQSLGFSGVERSGVERSEVVQEEVRSS